MEDKLKAGNDDLCVLFTSGLYSGTRSSHIDWRSVQYNDNKFITHENFLCIWFSEMCEILYTQKFLRYAGLDKGTTLKTSKGSFTLMHYNTHCTKAHQTDNSHSLHSHCILQGELSYTTNCICVCE